MIGSYLKQAGTLNLSKGQNNFSMKSYKLACKDISVDFREKWP